ncbi:hypothetical protein KIPB_011710, partial [Kipferlia bialata]|eukprot:g11710.t1
MDHRESMASGHALTSTLIDNTMISEPIQIVEE